MSERPNVYAENLLWAARRYGDACVACDRASREPRPGGFMVSDLPEHQELRERHIAINRAHSDAQTDLLRAARAYATNQRKKAKRKASPPRESSP